MLTGLEEAKQIIAVLGFLLLAVTLYLMSTGKCEHGCRECERKSTLTRERHAEARHPYHKTTGLGSADCPKCRAER